MPLQRTETYTTTGTKGSWNTDPSIAPFNLNVAVNLLNPGATSYKLQYTYDHFGPLTADTDVTWFDSPGIPAGTAASAAQQFNAPISAIRIVIEILSGGASLQMIMRQGMSIN